MDRAEFLNDRRFLLDAILEAGFEFVELSLLLVEVLDEAATAFLHLVETALEADPVRRLVPLTVLDLVVGHGVLRVPHVVRNELLDLVLPRNFQIVVVDRFDFSHQALHVLDQNVVASDEDTLLSATTRADSISNACRCRLHGGLRVRLGGGASVRGHGGVLDARHGLGGLGLARIHDVLVSSGVLARASDWARLLCLLHIFLLFFFLELGLVLLLLLVLLVRRQRHVHLHLDLGSRARCDRRPQDFVREEHFVQHLVVWARAHEKLVVDVRIFSRVDPDEVSTALVLCDSLSDVLLVAKAGRLLHRVDQYGEFLRVLDGQALNQLVELGTCLVMGRVV